MKQVFNVQSDSDENKFYSVTFIAEDEFRAHCTCDSCRHNNVCKHILKLLAKNENFSELLKEQNLYKYYKDIVEKQKEYAGLQDEAKVLKKEIASLNKRFGKKFLLNS